MQQTQAQFVGENVRKGDWCVARFRNDQLGVFSVTVVQPRGTLKASCDYLLHGRFQTHPKFGQQFKAESIIALQPKRRMGVVRLLIEAGLGTQAANTLWDDFGAESVSVVRDTPEVAATRLGPRFKRQKILEAAEYLYRDQSRTEAKIALLGLCDEFKINKRVIDGAINTFGANAAQVIKRDPYRLMQVPGAGFATADRVYIGLGYDPARLKRQTLALYHAMSHAGKGNTWFSTNDADKLLQKNIGSAQPETNRAIRLGKIARKIAIRSDLSDTTRVAPMPHAVDEFTVAERMAEITSIRGRWPSIDQAFFADLTEHQRQAVRRATSSRRGLLLGLPGTGKTYSMTRLIHRICREHGSSRLAIASPTNKAVRRIEELISDAGVDAQPETIHSLLGVDGVEDGVFHFRHHADNPLAYDFILVDESSMISTSLMASLLSACRPSTHVIFIGDPGQLPPIAHGRPLHDLASAGVPCGYLTEIQRNCGSIVRACHSIKEGRTFEHYQQLSLDEGRNLKLIESDSENTVVKIVKNLVHKGFDARRDIQVIIGTNRMRIRMNRQLQQHLNPVGKQIKGSPFRAGDKVVSTANGMLPLAHRDGEIFVANGQQGIVADVEPKRTLVDFDGCAKTLVVPHGDRPDDDPTAQPGLQLAYACTCHKAQGSQWKATVVVVENQAARFFDRSWLFTALSRAEQLCIVCGQPHSISQLIRRDNLQQRKTFLVETIREFRNGQG